MKTFLPILFLIFVVASEAQTQDTGTVGLESKVRERLEKLVIPRVDFVDTRLDFPVGLIHMRVSEVGSGTINIVMSPEVGERRIDILQIKNISTLDLYKTLAKKTGTELRVTGDRVEFISLPPPPIDAKKVLD